MHGANSPIHDQSPKWWKKALLVLWAPIAIVLLPMFFAIGFVDSILRRRARSSRLIQSLRRTNATGDVLQTRLSNWSKLETQLTTCRECPGTVIVDNTCLGWNDVDVWWSPEPLLRHAAEEGVSIPEGIDDSVMNDFESRMRNPIPDRWCQNRYLNAQTGTAQLVQSSRTLRERTAAMTRITQLQAAYPRLAVVEIHTCLLRIARHS